MTKRITVIIMIFIISFIIILCSGNEDRPYIDKSGDVFFHSFSEGLSAFRINGKMGFIDKTGKVVIQPIYDQTLSFQESMAAVSVNDRWFYIDKNGEMVFDETFDLAYSFSLDGLAPVKKGDVIFYIDINGNHLYLPENIDMSYYMFQGYSEGLAIIKVDGKYGYMNKRGKIVIQPEYVYAEPFSEELAVVRKNGLYGYIDKKSDIVIQPKFTKACSFSEGLAPVMLDGIGGYIDREGNFIYKVMYGMCNRFSEGRGWCYTMVSFDNNKKIRVNYYLLDRSGNRIREWETIYNNTGLSVGYQVFSEGLSAFSIKKWSYGFIDKEGDIVIKPIYKSVFSFSEGLASVYGNFDGEYKYVFIDKNGDVVIDELIW